MNESEIIRLGMKVQQLRKTYENVSVRRENHVLELNSLDNQIDDIEKSLKGLEEEKQSNKRMKELLKKDTKPAFIRMGVAVLIALILRMIIDTFIKIHLYTINQYILNVFLPILSLCISINLLPNLILRIIYYVNSIKTNNKYEALEKTKQELISKRILLGSKYKDIRESEVMAKGIYKETEKILSSELIHLYNMSDEYRPIDTRDIYYKIRVDESYYKETSENQKKIIDDLLKDYLREKLLKSNFNKINLFIDDLSVEDLFLILLERVPKNNHHEVLNHIIHAILGISSNMQNYSIVWFEESDKKLINNPEIVYDEMGKWTEFKTHRGTSYELIFKTIYNEFINCFMKKDEYIRKRDKK